MVSAFNFCSAALNSAIAFLIPFIVNPPDSVMVGHKCQIRRRKYQMVLHYHICTNLNPNGFTVITVAEVRN